MKATFLSIILFSICFGIIAQSNDVHINSLGFLPNHNKSATITKECTSFNVTDTEGNIVFSGKTDGPYFQEDVNQNVWKANFTAFNNRFRYNFIHFYQLTV